MRFGFFDVGDVRLHVASTGDPANPLIICLHGFPEYWAAWQEVMLELAGDFHVVAPDQRGFNLSSKPAGEEAYRAKHLVADVAALADQLSPGKPFILAGHDWGASIAYAYAFAHPDRLTRLVIANGVHPVCFQRAILQDAGQRRASQYFHKLRAAGAAERMVEDDFARTLRMIAGFSKTDWMTPEIEAHHRAAWARPGAMQAMLHWYNSSPVVVPRPDEVVTDAPLLSMEPDRARVRMPHLVIWGEADEALRPVCLGGLDRFAADLTVKKVAGAGHWILHEKPVEVAAIIRKFLEPATAGSDK
ncbi:epoxide hydrolase [Mesorhizobium sp. L-8-10]|uniref:alpha/beta fold hydrolase n=1 Tax=Mesorhizobium sp. L-8-10 TaxID=2744523 RepID=UPI0019252947|nr:alpha/beta hydrolase [Mesorhizobium sp. L-8-10]BCH33566.1 epoxide hydrolase [Mesorhizobium sp. L-8-10]